MVAAQELERQRLARELHDETGQALTSILLGLKGVEQEIATEEARAALASVRDTVATTLQGVRRLAVELRPSALDDFGLVPALERLAATFGEQTQIAVDFEAKLDDERFSPEVETTLYRIVQEALTNVVKHASRDPRLDPDRPARRLGGRRRGGRRARDRARRPGATGSDWWACANGRRSSAAGCTSSRRRTAGRRSPPRCRSVDDSRPRRGHARRGQDAIRYATMSTSHAARSTAVAAAVLGRADDEQVDVEVACDLEERLGPGPFGSEAPRDDVPAEQRLTRLVHESAELGRRAFGALRRGDDRDRGAVDRQVGHGVERPPGGARAVVADEDLAGSRGHQWLIVPFGLPIFRRPT